MAPVFVLTANDRPGDPLFRELCEEALALAGCAAGAKLVACAIGAAHGDQRPRMKGVAREVSRLVRGGPCSTPFLTDPALDASAARREIEAAEAFYFDGGDTLEIVRGAAAHGLVDAFRSAARTAKLISGLSAGACVMSGCTVGWDDAGEVPHVAPCLDLGLPWPIDVHAEEDDWPEVRTLLELLERRGDRDPAVLAIPTGGAAIVIDGRVLSRGTAPSELRRLGKGGAWRVETIPLP